MSTMTMTPEVEAAEQAVRDAENAAAVLAEKVQAGDVAVTGAELAASEQAVTLARLRVEAARRTGSARLESEREARAQAVAADVRQLVTDDDPEGIAASMRVAVDAVAALHAVVAARQDRIRGMAGRIAVVQSELTAAGIAERVHTRYGVGPSPVVGKLGIVTAGGTAAGVAPADALAAVVALAVADVDARAAIAGAMQNSGGRADQVRAEVPAVAAEFGGVQ